MGECNDTFAAPEPAAGDDACGKGRQAVALLSATQSQPRDRRVHALAPTRRCIFSTAAPPSWAGAFAAPTTRPAPTAQRFGLPPGGPIFKSVSGELSNLRWDLPIQEMPNYWGKANRCGSAAHGLRGPALVLGSYQRACQRRAGCVGGT